MSKFDHVVAPNSSKWPNRRVAVIGKSVADGDGVLVVQDGDGNIATFFDYAITPAPPEPLVVWVSRRDWNAFANDHAASVYVYRKHDSDDIPLTITAESIAAAEKEVGK